MKKQFTKKIMTVAEISLSLFCVICSILAYMAEDYRTFVCVLGVLYFLAFGVLLAFGVKSTKEERFPFGIVILTCLLIVFQNNSINSTYIGIITPRVSTVVLSSVVILTIIIASLLFKMQKIARKLRGLLFDLLFGLIVSIGLLFYCILPMTNYAFDNTATTEIDVTVTAFTKEDNFSQRVPPYDTHNVYSVTCADIPELKEISIDADCGMLENGTVVRLKYRKGVFMGMYRVDYGELEKR